jgi:hypothetical protein
MQGIEPGTSSPYLIALPTELSRLEKLVVFIYLRVRKHRDVLNIQGDVYSLDEFTALCITEAGAPPTARLI